MKRVYELAVLTFCLMLLSMPSNAEELTATQIFDAMVHYESDQLETSASINDYHCIVTETTQRVGLATTEVLVKDLYFMAPNMLLYMIDRQPSGYFSDQKMIELLEMSELSRQRDETVNGVDCYVIERKPLDPAFKQYYWIYYVAKDDYRHVKTISHHANYQYDSLLTTTEYVYSKVGDFVLLTGTTKDSKDDKDNLLATVETTYTDYEFGLGLTVENFMEWTKDSADPIAPLN